jgi:hypothetical protein
MTEPKDDLRMTRLNPEPMSDQQRATYNEYQRLRLAGHAAGLEAQYDSEGKLLEVKLHHYLTCVKCQESKPKPAEKIPGFGGDKA